MAGCGRAGAPNVVRLIPDDAESIFAVESISAREARFDWSFAAPAAGKLAPGRPVLSLDDGWGEVDSGLLAQSATGTIGVQMSTSIEAATVSEIVVTVSHLNRGGVRLGWDVAGARGPRSERVMFVGHLEHSGAAQKRYTFDLRSHPGWSGRVSALRVQFTGLFQSHVLLRRVQGFQRVLTEEKLGSAVSRPWKVQVGNELRTARLAPPGVALRHRVRFPRGKSVLRFARATTARLDRPVEFVVRAETIGGEAQEVFRESLAAGGSPAEWGWRQEEVDLSDMAGQEGELVFETVSAEPLDLLSGMPVWGHPEIVPLASPPLANLVLISVDTLRADHLSLYGYDRATSPHLEAWARSRAVIFEQAIAQAPWTLPSHLSMLSGLDALRHGANHQSSVAPANLPMLAETLRQVGYWTEAITGSGFVHPRYGFAQGFDVYYHDPRKTASAEELELELEQALSALRRMRRPFFLFFHTFEVHTPLRPRQPFFDRFSDRPAPDRGVVVMDGQGIRLRVGSSQEPFDDPAMAVDLYDSGIAYTDARLGRLLEVVREDAVSGPTMIVFTSDHGEAFGRGGEFGHNHLTENNLRVPLVIEFPDGRSAGTSIPHQVRLVDIVPTVLESLGIAPGAALDGVSLMPFLSGDRPAPTRVATSYTSRRNRGLALRLDNSLKYLFDPTPWGGAAREQVVEVRRQPVDVAVDYPDTERLRSQALQRFTAASGLWLRLANGTSGLLRGSIVAEAVHWDTVKSADMPCACLELKRPGEASFRVPAQSSFSLLFELVQEPEMRLLGALEPGGAGPALAFDETLRLDAEEVNAVLFNGSGWELSSTDVGRLVTGLAFEWSGLKQPSAAAAPEVDADLADQLRALGYVD